jgi:PiT family inorganic phosphate transporter
MASTHLALFIVSAFFAALMAYAIGANDVANAIATSVGSKTLSMRTAIVMASICEFSGASLMGAKVTGTISKGIVDPQEFADNPDLFMAGMLSSLVGSSVWLLLATYFKLPVSTTHSIVGGIIGFTILEKGAHTLNWSKIAFIASSWIVSPLLGGIIAFILYYIVNRFILERKNALHWCYKFQPFLYGICAGFMGAFLVYETIPNLSKDIPLYVYIVVPVGLFIVVALLVKYFLVPYLIEHEQDAIESLAMMDAKDEAGSIMSTNSHFEQILVFKTFMPLQVLTSCLVAFAHGANDVANAVGPFTAILSVYQNHRVPDKVTTPHWVLLAGGVAIVLGLATLGYRVLYTMGEKITRLNPPRGFSAEFAGSFTVMFASIVGSPISTTHTLVGAISGVGLVKGFDQVNTKIIRNIVLSWIVTIPAGMLLSMGTFAVLRIYVH